MEGDTEKISLETDKKHMLNSKWIVWYHNPSDQSWTIDSYKDILEIDTVEDFLVLKNSWEQCFFLVSKMVCGREMIFLVWKYFLVEKYYFLVWI